MPLLDAGWEQAANYHILTLPTTLKGPYMYLYKKTLFKDDTNKMCVEVQRTICNKNRTNPQDNKTT